MSNTITIELCAEDRARLDKIIEGLAAIGKRPDCQQCVKDVAHFIDKAEQAIDGKPEKDPAQQALADALARGKTDRAEAPKNAQDAPGVLDHPTLDPFPEQPTAKAEASEASEKPVSTAELQQLVISLCRAGKKDKVREVVNAYGVQTVAAIPEDKRTEAFKKLKTLEG